MDIMLVTSHKGSGMLTSGLKRVDFLAPISALLCSKSLSANHPLYSNSLSGFVPLWCVSHTKTIPAPLRCSGEVIIVDHSVPQCSVKFATTMILSP